MGFVYGGLAFSQGSSVIRFLSRWKVHRKLFLDDYMVLVAQLLALALTTTSTMSKLTGTRWKVFQANQWFVIVVVYGFGQHIYQVHIDKVSEILFLGEFRSCYWRSLFSRTRLTNDSNSLVFRRDVRHTTMFYKSRARTVLPPDIPTTLVSYLLQVTSCQNRNFWSDVDNTPYISMSLCPYELGNQPSWTEMPWRTSDCVCWSWDKYPARRDDFAFTRSAIATNPRWNKQKVGSAFHVQCWNLVRLPLPLSSP
jgi:hypothetical protein